MSPAAQAADAHGSGLGEAPAKNPGVDRNGMFIRNLPQAPGVGALSAVCGFRRSDHFSDKGDAQPWSGLRSHAVAKVWGKRRHGPSPLTQHSHCWGSAENSQNNAWNCNTNNANVNNNNNKWNSNYVRPSLDCRKDNGAKSEIAVVKDRHPMPLLPCCCWLARV